MLDKKMTYRLIGAGIMIVAAAIILPQILDGERPPELDVQVAVSKAPTFSTVDIASAQPVDSLPEPTQSLPEPITDGMSKSAQDIQLVPVAKQAEDKPAPVVNQEVKKVVKSTPAKAIAQPTGRWTVQIATFAQEANAKRLVEKLKEADYSAYSVTTNSLFKVFVGPELERDASEKVQASIQKKFSLKGIVVKFSGN